MFAFIFIYATTPATRIIQTVRKIDTPNTDSIINTGDDFTFMIKSSLNAWGLMHYIIEYIRKKDILKTVSSAKLKAVLYKTWYSLKYVKNFDILGIFKFLDSYKQDTLVPHRKGFQKIFGSKLESAFEAAGAVVKDVGMRELSANQTNLIEMKGDVKKSL